MRSTSVFFSFSCSLYRGGGALWLFFLGAPHALQAQLVAEEQAIIKHIDEHRQEAFDLWEKAVNINSGSMNFEGVRKVGQLFKDELDQLGFNARWVDGASFGRAGHLVAAHKGKGKTILLIGHLDTVFEPSSPFQRFETLNDSTVRGPGVGDMKGGDVIMLEAVRALHKAGALKDMSLIVVMTGDEEMSGRPLQKARHDLIEAAKSADVAIGFEDSDGDPATAVVARRGSVGWKLTVQGTPAHSSQLFKPEVGAGAAYEAARILNEFYKALSGRKNITVNPGALMAGTSLDYSDDKTGGSVYGKSNIVAGKAVATGDIRTLSQGQLDFVKKTMKKITETNYPGTRAEITFGEGYPPLPPTAGNYQLLTYFSRVSRDLGFGTVEPVDPGNAGAADISFAAAHVDMAIDGLGPKSKGGHTIEETADPRTLAMQAKRTALLLYRLSYDEDGKIRK